MKIEIYKKDKNIILQYMNNYRNNIYITIYNKYLMEHITTFATFQEPYSTTSYFQGVQKDNTDLKWVRNKN